MILIVSPGLALTATVAGWLVYGVIALVALMNPMICWHNARTGDGVSGVPLVAEIVAVVGCLFIWETHKFGGPAFYWQVLLAVVLLDFGGCWVAAGIARAIGVDRVKEGEIAWRVEFDSTKPEHEMRGVRVHLLSSEHKAKAFPHVRAALPLERNAVRIIFRRGTSDSEREAVRQMLVSKHAARQIVEHAE